MKIKVRKFLKIELIMENQKVWYYKIKRNIKKN